MGRLDGREGLGMSPTFTSSPTCRHKHGKKMKAHTLGTRFTRRFKRETKVSQRLDERLVQEKRRKGKCRSGLQKEAKQEVKQKMEG